MRDHRRYRVVRHGSAWFDGTGVPHDHPLLSPHCVLITEGEKIA